MPTLAKLLEADAPAETDGLDLAPLLFDQHLREQPEVSKPRELYWVWSSGSNRRALRYGDWKVVRYGKKEPAQPGDWQLYDLASDPMEQQDLASERADVLADMHRRYLAQRAADAPNPKRR